MIPDSINQPVVAAFDFDGTLTRHDTLLPFLMHLTGIPIFIFKFILLIPIFGAYALRLMPNDVAKNKVLIRFLNTRSMADLHLKASDFALRKIPAMHRQQAMQRFNWHKQQGHRCVVISASLELYLRPWAINAGFDDVIGSRLNENPDGSTTGSLSGNNCYGPEKTRRLQELLGPRENYILYAYGDSRGDRELLSMADYSYYRTFGE